MTTTKLLRDYATDRGRVDGDERPVHVDPSDEVQNADPRADEFGTTNMPTDSDHVQRCPWQSVATVENEVPVDDVAITALSGVPDPVGAPWVATKIPSEGDQQIPRHVPLFGKAEVRSVQLTPSGEVITTFVTLATATNNDCCGDQHMACHE
jgi:hypothetical protein